MSHLNNKWNKNTNPIISRQDHHLTQPCPSEEKQTRKQKLSRNLTLYQAYTNHWTNPAAAAAKSLQSCPILCNPIDRSPPGSPVPGILQARTLEWVAISFSDAWKWKVKGKSLSHVRLLVMPWTGAYQAPPSMGFSREEYWSGVFYGALSSK